MRLHSVTTGQSQAWRACGHAAVRNRICRIVTADGSHAHFRLEGEFDLSDAQQLFETLVQDAESTTFTIDLLQTRSIDAGILGAFARLARVRRELSAAPVRVRNAGDQVRRLFEICELDRLLDCQDAIYSPRP